MKRNSSSSNPKKNQTVEDFILEHSSSKDELRANIELLIEHREALRDTRLEELREEALLLRERLKEIEREKNFEEIRCFKEILSWKKRMNEHGKSNH